MAFGSAILSPEVARKKRNRPVELVGAVLGRDKTLKSIPIETPPLPLRDWEVAVGSRIAARTRPDRLDKGVLHVVTASAAWSQELSLLSEAILARLARLGVEVTALRFRVGSIEVAREIPRAVEKRAPRLAPLDEPLARAIASVADDELRGAIARAARRSLGFAGDG